MQEEKRPMIELSEEAKADIESHNFRERNESAKSVEKATKQLGDGSEDAAVVTDAVGRSNKGDAGGVTPLQRQASAIKAMEHTGTAFSEPKKRSSLCILL
jgi:hypothetical protein